MLSQAYIPVAEYVRMSTENQKYSIPNQQAAIREYATEHGFSVCRIYVDAGKSGLLVKDREGLRELLRDVVAGVSYKAILVYDVSRWGRFLDADESAHYEFLCKSAGITVHYCAEPFQNDGSLPSTILKTLKRMMAAEYSRELSAKVYEGSKRMAERGFSTGGAAGYGLRRVLVSPNNEFKQELQFGERKNIHEDRVIFVPGPEQEVECVRQMFRMFTKGGLRPGQIAAELNRMGVPFTGYKHRQWNFNTVDRILKNPKYAGYAVYGRSTARLGIPRTRIPSRYWIKTPGVRTPIIDVDMFASAESIYANRPHNKTDEQVLSELRVLLESAGTLSGPLLRASNNLRSNQSYVWRFGSLSEAFALAGYEGPTLFATRTRRRLRALRDRLLQEIVRLSEGHVSQIQEDWARAPKLLVNSSKIVGVRCCLSYKVKDGSLRWAIQRRRKRQPDVASLVARLNATNDDFHDLYLISSIPDLSHWRMLPIDPWLEKGEKLNSLAEFANTAQRVARPKSGFLFEE